MRPALAQLPEPSAGLTMLVARYSYDYAGHLLAGADPNAPVAVLSDLAG